MSLLRSGRQDSVSGGDTHHYPPILRFDPAPAVEARRPYFDATAKKKKGGNRASIGKKQCDGISTECNKCTHDMCFIRTSGWPRTVVRVTDTATLLPVYSGPVDVILQEDGSHHAELRGSEKNGKPIRSPKYYSHTPLCLRERELRP